jgi:hypothetical protein
MQLLRIVNAFFASLFLVMAALSVVFLGAAEGAVGGGGPAAAAAWAGLFVLFAILAFLNMRGAAAERVPRRLLPLNLAAALPMLIGVAGLAGSGRFLCGAAAFPFLLTAGLLAARGKTEPA